MAEDRKRPETLRAALIEAIFYGKDRLCYVAIIIAMLGLTPHVLSGLVDTIKAFSPVQHVQATSLEEKK